MTTNRLAALLSLLLFATSPTVMLWSPQPESRLFGLPFVLIGLWLIVRANPASGSREAHPWPYFLAGSLFGLGQAIHYTSLYLLVPGCPGLLRSRSLAALAPRQLLA